MATFFVLSWRSIWCHRSGCGQIGQLEEALFGESKNWTNQEKWVWTITPTCVRTRAILLVHTKIVLPDALATAYEQDRPSRQVFFVLTFSKRRRKRFFHRNHFAPMVRISPLRRAASNRGLNLPVYEKPPDCPSKIHDVSYICEKDI